MRTMPRPTTVLALIALATGAPGQTPQDQPKAATAEGPANPYKLTPFFADFPVALEYPLQSGRDYDRTRRQAIARVVANLQGNATRNAWQMAMEFFWHGPEDAIDPLVEAMDRAFGNPALADAVKNCVEAMGKMSNVAFDGPLLRALEHKNPNVRQAALTALATSGKVETLRGLYRFFPQMDSRSRAAWLRAARTRLGADSVPMLRELMMAKFHSSVRDQVLQETLQLPAAQAAEVLRGRWQEAIGEFKPVIAGVLHAAGDGTGTAWLLDTMKGDDPVMLVQAIKNSTRGDLGVLLDSLLRLSSHPRPDVRYEVARALIGVEAPQVAEVYELLAGPDETMDTRAIALRELTRRGRNQVVSALLAEVPTATGTRAQMLINELAQSADPRAVPIFVERFEQAPAGEGRPFVQALALSRGNAACDALVKLFLGPERVVDRGRSETYTTLSYLPTLLLNLRGSEARLVAAFRAIPKEDWKRRAALLTTVAGLAGDRDDAKIKELCVPVVREILFDRSEVPQLRVLALNLLTKNFLELDDAMKLKNGRPEESPQMRVLLGDFLNEYF